MAISGKVYIAGHRGMVGSALVRHLESNPNVELVVRTRGELDLCDPAAVDAFIQEEKPQNIIIAAARVGGIHANSTYPAEFIYENLSIAVNIIHSAYKYGVKRLLNLGSSCIYPRDVTQPMQESALLTAPLEKTNEAYAVAKIAALKMCEYYRQQYGVLFHSAMPTNLYGPGDNYHPENSHVLPGLIRRFHEAKEANLEEVVVWGTGTPMREFLYVDDLADGILHLMSMENPPDLVNLGYGSDISIGGIAELVKETIGFEGKLTFDTSKPDGTPRKLMDNTVARTTGWKPKISLGEGLKLTYKDFKEHLNTGDIRSK